MDGEKAHRTESFRVERHSAELPPPVSYKGGVIYVSDKYKTAIHLCACGCGNLTVTPPKRGWTLGGTDDKPTLRPSVYNANSCGSHYFITNGKVEWLADPFPNVKPARFTRHRPV